MITTASFNDLVKNAYVSWAKAREEFPSVRSQLAVIKSVTEKTSEHSSLSMLPTARRRDDGGDAFKGSLKQGYRKNFNQKEIALQVDVTKQMRMFDKYDEIFSKMRMMGKSAERRVELDIASLLSYAWSSSYTNIDGETVTTTTPDGNTLIYTAHACNGSTSTYSNSIATTHSPFDQNVLEKLEELFNNFLDESDGRIVPVMPDTIITGRHAPTVHAVKRVLNSEFYTENANHSSNTVKNYKHLVVPFIDMNAQTEARDANKLRYCFLAALGDKDANKFLIEESQAVRFEAPEQVFESSVWQFLTTGLYDFGTLGANFIAGTKGDGTGV